jgi:hypothetical protein
MPSSKFGIGNALSAIIKPISGQPLSDDTIDLLNTFGGIEVVTTFAQVACTGKPPASNTSLATAALTSVAASLAPEALRRALLTAGEIGIGAGDPTSGAVADFVFEPPDEVSQAPSRGRVSAPLPPQPPVPRPGPVADPPGKVQEPQQVPPKGDKNGGPGGGGGDPKPGEIPLEPPDVPARAGFCWNHVETKSVVNGVSQGSFNLKVQTPALNLDVMVSVVITAEQPVMNGGLQGGCPELCVGEWVQGFARAKMVFTFTASAGAAIPDKLKDAGVPAPGAGGGIMITFEATVLEFLHYPGGAFTKPAF